MTNPATTMQLELVGDVHRLTLTNGDHDNLLTIDVLNEYLQALKQVTEYEGNTALLITCHHEKTWSNGINLEWLMAEGASRFDEFREILEQVIYRLTLLNAPTVACVNGNAYAGGAIFLAGCDFRLMRQDRGRLCYPEVDIKIPFTDMMHGVLQCLPNQQLLKRMTLLGEKVTGQQAFDQGIIDGVFPPEQLQDTALEYAALLATKDRATYSSIKNGLKTHMLRWQKEFG